MRLTVLDVSGRSFVSDTGTNLQPSSWPSSSSWSERSFAWSSEIAECFFSLIASRCFKFCISASFLFTSFFRSCSRLCCRVYVNGVTIQHHIENITWGVNTRFDVSFAIPAQLHVVFPKRQSGILDLGFGSRVVVHLEQTQVGITQSRVCWLVLSTNLFPCNLWKTCGRNYIAPETVEDPFEYLAELLDLGLRRLC